jgi:hypothetical protein
LASNLNFAAGQTVPNLVVVKVGQGGANEGKVSIANTALSSGAPAAGIVHVIADVVGYYGDATTLPGGRFVGLTPNRVLDTRNGTGLASAFAPNQIRELSVTGSGIPADVDAVVLNVTATQPSAPGWLTLFPTGDALPLASNLNFAAGQTVPNLVVVKVGHGGANEGKVSIANTALPSGAPAAGIVHVIADVVGYYQTGADPGSALTAIAPQRILDTRASPGMPVGPNATITVDPTTATGLPPAGSYAGVVVNVTVTQPAQAGWLTVYSSDTSLPLASNLNFTAGQTVPNLVKVKVGADGTLKIANTALPSNPQPAAGAAHVIVDLVGYYA